MKITSTVFLILSFINYNCFSQEINDNCVDAIYLCDGLTLQGNNIFSTIDNTPTGDDGDGTNVNCTINSDLSVWYTFETNSNGGNTTLTIDNINCVTENLRSETLNAYIINTLFPCDASTYNLISSCEQNNNSIQINLTGLTPNTKYYISVSGDKTLPNTKPAACDFSITINGAATAFVNLNPIISTYPLNSFCNYTPSTFEVSENNNTYNNLYQWYVNGTLFETTASNSLTTTNLPGGNLSISASIIANKNGCNSTQSSPSVNIDVIDVNVNAGNDVNINNGETTTLNGSANGTFVWTPTAYLDDSTTLSPNTTPPNTIIYVLSSTYLGCSASDAVTIIVSNYINIPDAITPNNDNFNDTWILNKIENYPFNKVKVYNRWGQIVYKIDGYSNNNSWNGEYNGKLLPSGSYIYVIDLNNNSPENDIYKGTLNIIY